MNLPQLNKLSEHHHVHLFMYYLWLLLTQSLIHSRFPAVINDSAMTNLELYHVMNLG